MKKNDELILISKKFDLKSPPISVDTVGEGFINDTYILKTKDDDLKYILQRKNHIVFNDISGMMNNIEKVTNHLKHKMIQCKKDPERYVLTLIKTLEGELFSVDIEGNCWIVMLFINNSKTFYSVEGKTDLAYKSGETIGNFQLLLEDFDVDLVETIKGFHNIKQRLIQWDECLKNNKANRIDKLKEEIYWIESRREKMLAFWNLVETGRIPMRITHNDTKISNILFDLNDEPLCVIDLDTVMKSTSLNDFGDSIRSYANSASEDEENYDNVSIRMDIFKAFASGYLSKMSAILTDIELKYLAFSALYITYEQVLRFLMDYINGDIYYKIKYPDHNIVRTRSQYRLLVDMENKYDEMVNIIRELSKRNFDSVSLSQTSS